MPERWIFKTGKSHEVSLLLTAAVRDLHASHPGRFLTDVQTPHTGFWENNPYLTPLGEDAPEVSVLELHKVAFPAPDKHPAHLVETFGRVVGRELGVPVTPVRASPDIHLTIEEKTAPPPIAGAPYWIVAAGGTYDTSINWWNRRRFQKVIDHFTGQINFIQVGNRRDYHPALKGTVDFRGKTSLRELVILFRHARGVLCPVSLFMHLAAAVDTPLGQPPLRPCVTVAGGRQTSHTYAYPGHRFLHTIGTLPCCESGGCWRSRTVKLGDKKRHDGRRNLCVDITNSMPHCMDMISGDDVIREIASARPTPGGSPPGGPDPHPVTVCVLFYGDFTDLCRRFFNSLIRNTDLQKIHLRIGLNAVCAETRALVDEITHLLPNPVSIYDEPTNIFKYPLMRKMFHDDPITTPWTIWFDDDSHITDPGWLHKFTSKISEKANADMLGRKCFINAGPEREAFVRAAPWYGGLPLAEKKHKKNSNKRKKIIMFATGGFWGIRTECIYRLDWPDPRIHHNGGDTMLGEATRQNGMKIYQFDEGVAISDAPRRSPSDVPPSA